MCNLILSVENGRQHYQVDGLTVSQDVFEAYRLRGHPCRIDCGGEHRLRLALAAAAPKRADAGRVIVPQDDASALDLFRFGNEGKLL